MFSKKDNIAGNPGIEEESVFDGSDYSLQRRRNLEQTFPQSEIVDI